MNGWCCRYGRSGEGNATAVKRNVPRGLARAFRGARKFKRGVYGGKTRSRCRRQIARVRRVGNEKGLFLPRIVKGGKVVCSKGESHACVGRGFARRTGNRVRRGFQIAVAHYAARKKQRSRVRKGDEVEGIAQLDAASQKGIADKRFIFVSQNALVHDQYNILRTANLSVTQ